MSIQKKHFLYSVKDCHPTFRVDLTELFSRRLVRKGFSIDWHMRACELLEDTDIDIKLNENENVFLGKSKKTKSRVASLFNFVFIVKHYLKAYKCILGNEYDFVQVRDQVFIVLFLKRLVVRKKIPLFYWLSFPHYDADILRAKEMSKVLQFPHKVYYFLRGHLSNFLLYKYVLPNSDFIFVQSDQMLRDLSDKGVPEAKMLPVPMGVNFESIDKINVSDYQDDRLEGKRVLVYLGTMIAERKIDFLIDMMPEVLNKHPDTVLLLVGDAPNKEMKFLKDRVQKLNLSDNVIFTGFIDMEKAWAYVKKATVGLSPFRPTAILNSASPTKLVEYLACSIPVVANNQPDQTKVINESGGGYVVNYDVSEFAEACVKLLDAPCLGQEMGLKGRQYVERFRSYDVISEMVYKKYEDLLADVK